MNEKTARHTMCTSVFSFIPQGNEKKKKKKKINNQFLNIAFFNVLSTCMIKGVDITYKYLLVSSPKFVDTLENTFALPKQIEFGTYMDVTARIPGDIIKPGDKLGNTTGSPEGANCENHTKKKKKKKKMTIFEHFFSV